MDGDSVGVGRGDLGDALIEGVEAPGFKHGGCVGPFFGEQEPRPEHAEELEVDGEEVAGEGVPDGLVEGVARGDAVDAGDLRGEVGGV